MLVWSQIWYLYLGFGPGYSVIYTVDKVCFHLMFCNALVLSGDHFFSSHPIIYSCFSFVYLWWCHAVFIFELMPCVQIMLILCLVLQHWGYCWRYFLISWYPVSCCMAYILVFVLVRRCCILSICWKLVFCCDSCISLYQL